LQIQRDISEQLSAPFPTPSIKEFVSRQLDANLSQLRQAGFDFDRWIELLKDFQIYEIGHNSSLPLHPGHYWTHLAGRQMAAFIGRVEDFESDFLTLCSMIGVDSPEKANRNVSGISCEETGIRSGYRHVHQMNRNSIDKINHLFREDFDLFGYSMVH
jgi:hypothetical protein